nr:immunoglobulin heavy chain junction region [Macaca mulatta]MOX60402.1 immunoglobulin heavy chain junction region [Macaca mulatta]MOX60725.1 immunoglobulin heavy chain junction region [Macaca mulatta]MOX60808.1 immunoglobulin heavy chain junction region [Macaca mulatta]MOX62314.1 immunoglobulin heavy chain junction region [Macaca mulatta]
CARGGEIVDSEIIEDYYGLDFW